MKSIKIGCVTKVVCEEDTASIKKIVRDCKIDLLVFPEMHDSTEDLGLKDLPEGESEIVAKEMKWSKKVNCAMIMGMDDNRGNIFRQLYTICPVFINMF